MKLKTIGLCAFCLLVTHHTLMNASELNNNNETENNYILDNDEPEFSDDDLDENEEEFEVGADLDVKAPSFTPKQALSHKTFLSPIIDNWAQAAHFTLSHQAAYGLRDPEQLIINRSSLRFQWEQLLADRFFFRFDGKTAYDFVYDRPDYNDNVRQRYRTVSGIREAYVQGNFGDLSIKVGKQLVVWGKADSAVVTDVMSPRDLTELVFTEVEDSRLGQQMITFDYYRGASRWSLVLNPDVKVNLLADPGHPYSTLASTLIDAVPEVEPNEDSNNMEVGLRWGTTIEQWDFALMTAEVFTDNPVFDYTPPVTVEAIYPRYQMFGAGFNFGSGKFVWKGELAFKKNRLFNRTDSLALTKYRVWDSAFGFDFDDNGAYNLSMEVTNQHILHWDDGISGQRRNESNLYTIISKNFWDETLTLKYTNSYQLQDDEHFHRFEYIQDVNNHVTLSLQADAFNSHKDTTLLGQLEGKHRLSARVDFDF